MPTQAKTPVAKRANKEEGSGTSATGGSKALSLKPTRLRALSALGLMLPGQSIVRVPLMEVMAETTPELNVVNSVLPAVAVLVKGAGDPLILNPLMLPDNREG